MGAFLEQAKHNESLLDLLDKHFPNDFFDWKITVAFYSTLHYMNEYLQSHKVSVRDHTERNYELNPASANSFYPLSQKNWDKYYDVYHKCRAVRYSGIRNKALADLKWKADYLIVRTHLKDLKEFVEDDLAQQP